MLNLWVRTNYEWSTYCFDKGLSRNSALKIFEKTIRMQNFADILIIITLLQIFICFFLLFVIFIPFYKAYHSGDPTDNKVYRQTLYNSIRSGDHLLIIGFRKFVNTCMNITQISLVLLVVGSNDNVIDDIKRISTIGCSDVLVNKSILNIN